MITRAQAVAYLAAGAAKPSCRKCHGRGTCGTLKTGEGRFTILICTCAAKAFPKLNESHEHIRIPSEALNNRSTRRQS